MSNDRPGVTAMKPALSELRKKDIVELKGSTLIIHDKPALEQLVGA